MQRVGPDPDGRQASMTAKARSHSNRLRGPSGLIHEGEGMITADEGTWPLCIVCNDGTRIAPFWVSRKVMRLVAGSGFGVRSVWACGRHSEEEIATVKARLRVVDGVAVMQGEMELGV